MRRKLVRIVVILTESKPKRNFWREFFRPFRLRYPGLGQTTQALSLADGFPEETLLFLRGILLPNNGLGTNNITGYGGANGAGL